MYLKIIVKHKLLLLLFLILFTGCEKKEKDYRLDFTKFIESDKFNYDMKMPSGVEVEPSNFNIDKKNNIVGVNLNLENKEWEFMEYSNMKLDMIYIGNIVIQYLDSENFNNDYDLYIVFRGILSEQIHYTYNYETDELLIPIKHQEYIDLCRQFGTDSIETIVQHPLGLEKVIDYGFGKIKHNKFEKERSPLYSIYILWLGDYFSFTDHDIGRGIIIV